MTKYIFVTGGVVSGLGKGITAASLGRLLKARGLKVAAQKLDPYINIDPGTMSPFQHGEVYVTEDGAETDLDLGHYERFIDEDLNKYSNLTTGKVYWNVLNKERRGEYLGSTVQVIPHITDEIKNFIYRVGTKTNADVVITEIGGTIGDIESQPFIEAIRQVSLEVGRNNSLFIHVCLVPYLSGSDEHKSKPTQHSVKELLGLGINPNIIVLRCDEPLEQNIFKKIAMFCNVKEECVIENRTLKCLYEAPLMLEKAHFSEVVCKELGLETKPIDLKEWTEMVERIKSRSNTINIALVGKYVVLHDAYLSVAEALRHAGYVNDSHIKIKWVSSDELKEENANSTEFDESTPYKVIDFMPGQNNEIDKGGTLRLGAYPCKIVKGTTTHKYYKSELIHERHRHRYEVNNEYRQMLIDNGLTISGTTLDDRLVDIIEISDRPFHIGVQFHPEFKSRPNKPHPLFIGFIKAALKTKNI